MTSNQENRMKEHNSNGKRGAKYLRAKKPTFMDNQARQMS